MDNHDWPAKGAFEAAARVRRLAARLDNLAVAFEQTGNSVVANRLYDIARDLDAEAERVTRAVSDQGAKDLREAQADVARTLTTLLERT